MRKHVISAKSVSNLRRNEVMRKFTLLSEESPPVDAGTARMVGQFEEEPTRKGHYYR